MNIVVNKDIGAVVDLVRIGAASTATAGGAGDNTAVVARGSTAKAWAWATRAARSR